MGEDLNGPVDSTYRQHLLSPKLVKSPAKVIWPCEKDEVGSAERRTQTTYPGKITESDVRVARKENPMYFAF
jgi:hypothetical protein